MLLVKREPSSTYSENLKIIETNVRYSLVGDEKVILITSSAPNEGKSTIAANYALTLSNSNKKVIIIDCDLRKSTVHKNFSISNQVGLTNYLVGENKLNEVIYKYSNNLHIITGGKNTLDPIKLLSSSKVDNLIKELKEIYDYVIIDACPALGFADVPILSSKVDGILLVCSASKTRKSQLEKCKRNVEKCNGKIIGVIINNMRYNKVMTYKYY